MRKILAGILIGSGIALTAPAAFASTEREFETSDRAVQTVQEPVQPVTQLTTSSAAAGVFSNGGHDRQ